MPKQNGFEVLHDGQQVGRIKWTLVEKVMIMDGTFLDPSLRGQNMGEKLLDEAADVARQHSYRMKAICPFVIQMFKRFSKYDDVKLH